MIPGANLPTLNFEQGLWQQGLRCVAGMDEAGRGALAGPVTVGVVILPCDAALLERLHGVRDSKQMRPNEREYFAVRIQAACLAWSTGDASAEEIDRMGIVRAVRLAATRAVGALSIPPDMLLADFNLSLPELEIPQAALVKGDQRCLSIAAASVLAKTSRDAWMCTLEGQYPGYGLAKHKGYGTRVHRAAILQLGASEIHRRSFRVRG